MLSRAAGDAPAFTVGVSLKMYFGHARTLEWMQRIAEIARTHEATASGAVELFVVPTFPALVPVGALAAEAGVALGAQDLFWEDAGAFTGEVSGAELREVGCRLVEIGHAERRALFGDDDERVRAKVAAAFRNDLVPLLCVGETERGSVEDAVELVLAQIGSALADADEAGAVGPILAAYEPVWAIGAPEPAEPAFIAGVVTALEAALAELPGRAGSRVIYGGSAGPGLLTALEGRVPGLFLGRFAHDPEAVGAILDEALALVRADSEARS
ncbi:triosephosphate isomerase [Rathayibacter sp. PhB151]|uniref:triose-phosphate isomerase family protein n=1 Tax=Rathayibacter sp. PhB151 TaxID=2485189 RepID=UPI0010DA6E71|nr:triose-phosphate isomerase family protein [Rathayibacter sp. PhB151]TDX79490.1 triosephosphate isomerase [Rathayibacter sp. PhB151]